MSSSNLQPGGTELADTLLAPERNSSCELNAADKFRQQHEAAYEAQEKARSSAVSEVNEHSATFPTLRKELRRRRSTARATAIVIRSRCPIETFLDPDCAKCQKIIRELDSKMRRGPRNADGQSLTRPQSETFFDPDCPKCRKMRLDPDCPECQKIIRELDSRKRRGPTYAGGKRSKFAERSGVKKPKRTQRYRSTHSSLNKGEMGSSKCKPQGMEHVSHALRSEKYPQTVVDAVLQIMDENPPTINTNPTTVKATPNTGVFIRSRPPSKSSLDPNYPQCQWIRLDPDCRQCQKLLKAARDKQKCRQKRKNRRSNSRNTKKRSGGKPKPKQRYRLRSYEPARRYCSQRSETDTSTKKDEEEKSNRHRPTKHASSSSVGAMKPGASASSLGSNGSSLSQDHEPMETK